MTRKWHYGCKHNGDWANGWYEFPVAKTLVPFLEIGYRVITADWRSR